MNKKALIRLGIFAVVLVIVLMVAKDCGSDTEDQHSNRYTYEMTTTKVNEGKKDKVSEVFLLMDPSVSMKGYFEVSKYKDATSNFISNVSLPLNNILTNRRASLKVKFGVAGNYNVSNVETLQKEIRDAKKFNAGTTLLDTMIYDAIQQVTDTSISILVSDMVLSHGGDRIKQKGIWYNKQTLDDLGAKIHTAIKKADNVNVLILQYYSDFNGDYYYDCTENNLEGRKRQFKGQLMKNRPYYLMVFGERNELESLLANDIFPKYNNLYASFGLDDSNMATSDLTIVLDQSSTWLWDDNTKTLRCSAKMDNEQEVITVEFNKPNIPTFINQEYKIGSYDNSTVIDTVTEIADKSNPDVLKFRVTLKPYNKLPNEGLLEFQLLSTNSDWVKEATVVDNNDAEIDTLSVLEKKTWGFSTIIDNIDAAFFGNQVRKPDMVSRVKFNISKN